MTPPRLKYIEDDYTFVENTYIRWHVLHHFHNAQPGEITFSHLRYLNSHPADIFAFPYDPINGFSNHGVIGGFRPHMYWTKLSPLELLAMVGD